MTSTNAGVRVEWMKSRAHCHRWQEELNLLPEEMRRTIVYHRWKADWWLARSNLRPEADTLLREGLCAYAVRQATIRRGLANRADFLWKKTLQVVSTTFPELNGTVDSDYFTRASTDGTEFNAGAVLRDDNDDNNDNSDDNDDGQELEESEASLAFMELDIS